MQLRYFFAQRSLFLFMIVVKSCFFRGLLAIHTDSINLRRTVLEIFPELVAEKYSKSRYKKIKIKILDWAGNFPDLNPIENLWLIIKLRLDIVKTVQQKQSLCSRMFHNFTFFEIKNAWGLIRWDFGHNQRNKKIFLIGRCFEGVPPPKV